MGTGSSFRTFGTSCHLANKTDYYLLSFPRLRFNVLSIDYVRVINCFYDYDYYDYDYQNYVANIKLQYIA